MMALLNALCLSLFSLGVLSATITLYEVAAPTPTATLQFSIGASFTISPVGVGEDGKTTYIEEGVLTEVVAIYSDSTTTLPPSPTTLKWIVEEDASGLLRQNFNSNSAVSSSTVGPNDAAKVIQSCNFQGTTAGSCVDLSDVPGLNETITTTYSGTLVPAYTLTETASIPGQTQDSRALTRNNIWGTSQLAGLLFGVWVILLVR